MGHYLEPDDPYFVVTGLPRTRTAWFSFYFDCIHEPIINSGLFKKKFRGICSSAFPVYCKNHPDAKVVFIDRDVDDVEASLKKAFPNGIGKVLPYQYRETLLEGVVMLEACKLLFPDALHVRYDEIDERMEEIHDYFFPYVRRFDKGRFEYYKSFNITVNETAYNDRLSLLGL